MKNIDNDHDNDAIAFYKAIYMDLKWAKARKSGIYRRKNKEYAVSGDVCFNLRLGKQTNCIDSIIGKDYPDIPDILNRYIQSGLNMSILPKTGALNNAKKGLGFDRMDTFIWALSLYYYKDRDMKALILNNGATLNMGIMNRLTLKDFLDSYNSVYDLCRDLYGISRKLVRRMIESGPKAVTNIDDLKDYVLLAIDFWRERAKTYRKLDGLNEYLPDKSDIIHKKTITGWFEKIKKIRSKSARVR